MSLSGHGRRDRAGRTRTRREHCPAIDGVEPRHLPSGATIAGTVFTDLTGNGLSSDDTPRAGVTVDLYQKGSTKVLESVKTAANGSYSFSGLSAGGYSVQQVVPSGTIATGGLDGHAVSLKAGQFVGGQNFADFLLLPKPSMSGLHYVVTTPSGKSTTVTTLDDHVAQGDTVTAVFDLKAPEQLTLVAYAAPNSDFNTANRQAQTIFSEASTKGGTGTKSLTVKVPDGYFQIDFVAGPAIDHLDTNSNVTYHAQDRFIDGDTGGTQHVPAATAPLGLIVSDDVDLADAGSLLARKQ
jgi:hypothetical protein